MRKKIGIALIAAGIILLAILIYLLDLPHWKKLDLEKIHAQPQATIVYDSGGNEAGTLYSAQNRQWISLSEVPEHVSSAFIAAEDQRFYNHSGVDIHRIFGALWHDVKTLSLSQGASTITQQLIKLTHLTGEKTLSRKVQEVFLALQLEKKLSKDEILEAYLNTVYFGSGAYGIEAAAQIYFGKNAADLTLAEGALLAGVIKSPTNYAPHIHPENALRRRNLILTQMHESGTISKEELLAARQTQLQLQPTETTSAQFGWYMDQVLAEAENALDMSTEEILSAGLHIHTALEPAIQQSADALFENGANFPDPAADGTAVQAALIAMDTLTGEIRAVVGGRSYDVQRGLNRATQMQRQPGSAIKPVSAYAAAIDACNLMPTSMAKDVQRDFGSGYMPGNAGGNYYGTVTLREALSRSLNVATVDLADLIGIQTVRRYIAKFGLPLAAQDVNLALALGAMTHGVSPAQLCGAYCALANGGTQVTAHCIRSIRDNEGTLLYQYRSPGGRAVKQSTAFLITDMLKTAASSGSARALSTAGLPVAGKTGTVGEDGGGNRDIWTVGYTPELAVAVWMGFDEPGSGHALPDYDGGSGYPARLCAALIKASARLLSGKDFAAPDNLIPADIDRAALESEKQILLAAPNTPEEYIQREWFFADNYPQAASTLWDAPAQIDDLQLIGEKNDPPALAFTSRDSGVDYLVLRKTDQQSEIAATLSANEGELIIWADTDAEVNKVYHYSILPRHRLLYDSGVLLTGLESKSVKYAPGGILNSLFGV